MTTVSQSAETTSGTEAQLETILQPDGHRIYVYEWPSATNEVRAILHICHGMGEHSRRYQRLARVLNANGWTVIAHDHRGHGHSISQGIAGHYADHDGWQKVTGDVAAVQKRIGEKHNGLPVFLLGHSMGSFIAQGYIAKFPVSPNLKGLILSATNIDPMLKLQALGLVIALERWRIGPLGHSPVLRKLTHDTFARSVRNPRTCNDWLSRDPAEVDAYCQDPWCGFECTLQLWDDLREGLVQISDALESARMPSHLPVYLLAGDRDPVGHFGQGPRKLANAYRKAGFSDVECRLYPGARHEPFNETDRDVISRDLLSWLEKRLKSKS